MTEGRESSGAGAGDERTGNDRVERSFVVATDSGKRAVTLTFDAEVDGTPVEGIAATAHEHVQRRTGEGGGERPLRVALEGAERTGVQFEFVDRQQEPVPADRDGLVEDLEDASGTPRLGVDETSDREAPPGTERLPGEPPFAVADVAEASDRVEIELSGTELVPGDYRGGDPGPVSRLVSGIVKAFDEGAEDGADPAAIGDLVDEQLPDGVSASSRGIVPESGTDVEHSDEDEARRSRS